MLFESILCAVLYVFFKCFDYQLGTLYAFRPIVVCPVVGAFLGDLNTGLVMGASIEALFMGSVSIGAYIPPDATSAGLLCTAYAILLHLDTEAAVGLAMPIGTLVLGVGSLAQIVSNWRRILSVARKIVPTGTPMFSPVPPLWKWVLILVTFPRSSCAVCRLHKVSFCSVLAVPDAKTAML